jgi:hypothetical protein
MLAALLLAEEAAKKSKAPFYIVAGLLIVFAFGLGIGGTLRQEREGAFPPSSGAVRGLIGVCAVLVAGTMVTAVLTA